jgi:hypothetical protein
MSMSPAEVQRARRKRISIIVGITLAVEIGLLVLGHFGPALRNLIRPVYWIVLLIAAATIWHAFRRHTTRDRRHGDRRRG